MGQLLVGADQRVCPIEKKTIRKCPAEWEKQATVWLSWPHNEKEWGKKGLPKIKEFYKELIRTILQFQDVNLILANEELLNEVETIHELSLRLKKIIIPNNDIWIRDYGPFFVENKILDFEFNAWGGKFPPWNLDNNIPKQIALYKGCEIESYPIILEGGAIDFNGNGLAISTEECLLNPNRNPRRDDARIVSTKKSYENILKSAFNIKEIIWLKQGLEGDHTDGHVDNIARFIDKKKILIATTKNKKDKNYEILQDNFGCLKKSRHKFDLIDILLPGLHNAASYINFIFVNGGVIVPTFNCKTDKIALDIFKKLFPKRKVMGIDCSLLIEEGGGLHCMSKQEPAQFKH